MTSSQSVSGQPSNGVVPHLPSPDPEVVGRARRRQFTISYKLRILDEADACKSGELGALLRREARYSSHPSCLRGALTASPRRAHPGSALRLPAPPRPAPQGPGGRRVGPPAPGE